MAAQSGKKAKQQEAIAALLTEPTLKAAAEKCGLGEKTLRRWLKQDSAFAEAYGDARAELVRGATGKLRRAMTKAVEVLEKVSDDQKAAAAARVTAASKILELGLRAVQVEDLAARLAKLETEREIEGEDLE